MIQVSAQFEENRIRNIQHEKDEKLKRFQDEVRLRVQALQKAKAQQQLQKSYKAVCGFIICIFTAEIYIKRIEKRQVAILRLYVICVPVPFVMMIHLHVIVI